MFGFDTAKVVMVAPDKALQGRETKMSVPGKHYVLGTPLEGPFPGKKIAYFALGCYWGAEKSFWQVPGVYSTAVGFAGGYTPNPTYYETCSGKTGHAETVQVVYDPAKVTYEQLLKVFWEGHNPTQGMQQGNDMGTQYRSAIYWMDEEQRKVAAASEAAYQKALTAAGHSGITTEVKQAGPFYYAEADHQQYLAKNPGGYCGHGGTGVSCPIGLALPKK